MIELVELFCQLVAVCGDARRTEVLACLCHSVGILAYLLYEVCLLCLERCALDSLGCEALCLCLAQY